jgi:glycosyltransferase involved in cell wall biosynthesis
MSSTPLVNILMPTYNHERFVAEAIESVLAQKTRFAYKLIVGDDCSTDSTQAIVRSYAEKYPDKIEFVFARQNLGAFHRDRVSIKLLNQFTAKYVAILEGDDYWTDCHKLQKQVAFLESHSDFVLCFHNVERFFADGSREPNNMYAADQKEVSTLEDIITAGVFPMPCALLFRNNLWEELPDCFFSVLNVDWVLSVIIAEHGKLGYLNEVMARYRVHDGGIWSRLTYIKGMREQLKTYETINAYLDFRYDGVLSKKIAALRASIAQQSKQEARSCLDQYRGLVKKGHVRRGFRLLWEAVNYAPSEVFHPRRFAGVVKNGFLGILYKIGLQT